MKAKNHRAVEHGQSLVEMALALPLLALILVGALDLGRIYFAYITITNAAREGARYGSYNPTDPDGIEDHAVAEASGSLFPISKTDVTISYPSGGYQAGDEIKVTVSVRFSLISSYIFRVGNISLQNSASFAIQQGYGS